MKYVKTDDGNIAAFVGAKSHYITPDDKNYDKLYGCLVDQDIEGFNSYLTDEDALNEFCEGYIKFDGGLPTWDGVPMPDLFTDRILDLVGQGHDFDAMINFTANLAENEDDHSILELIDFLRNRHLPITKDGCFLAYKAVTPEYKDIFSGSIDNSVGQEVEMDRKDVDPDRYKECSRGLHAGAVEYVKTYGDWNGGVDLENPADSHNKVVIVKINPKDVITVPTDHDFQKLRCMRYKVIAKFGGILEEAVYDDQVFFTADAPVEQDQAKPEGWREKLKAKFARIARLMKVNNA